MKFKLEFTFDISDSSLLIDANDGRSEEYTSLEDVPEDTLMDVVYNYLDGVIEGKSGFMYKNKFYSLETKYGWVF